MKYAIIALSLAFIASTVYAFSIETDPQKILEKQNREEVLQCLENVHSSTWTARILQEQIEECAKIELKTITWTASGAIVPPPERQEITQEVTKKDTFWQAYELAIPLIQKYEWLSLKAYPDPVRCTIWWWTVAKNCWESITQNEADMRLAVIVKQVTKRV